MRRSERLAPAIAAGMVLLSALLRDTAFVWRYIWGPNYAAVHGLEAATRNGVRAVAGYNIVNEIFYGVIAVLMLYGLVGLLREFDLAADWDFVRDAVPFMVFGALLRVIEDTGLVPLPYGAVLISPFIYVLLAGIVVGLIVVVHRTDLAGGRPFGRVFRGAGIALSLLAGLVLAGYGVIHGIDPAAVPGLAVVAGAIVLALGARRLLLDRYMVEDRLLTRMTGAIVIAAHTFDGAATAYAIDMLGYGEKHPVSLAIMQATGSSYGFLVVKMAFGLLVAWLITDDPDRFSVLTVLGIIAVGLGPGIRNLARALLGI